MLQIGEYVDANPLLGLAERIPLELSLDSVYYGETDVFAALGSGAGLYGGHQMLVKVVLRNTGTESYIIPNLKSVFRAVDSKGIPMMQKEIGYGPASGGFWRSSKPERLDPGKKAPTWLLFEGKALPQGNGLIYISDANGTARLGWPAPPENDTWIPIGENEAFLTQSFSVAEYDVVTSIQTTQGKLIAPQGSRFLLVHFVVSSLDSIQLQPSIGGEVRLDQISISGGGEVLCYVGVNDSRPLGCTRVSGNDLRLSDRQYYSPSDVGGWSAYPIPDDLRVESAVVRVGWMWGPIYGYLKGPQAVFLLR